MTGRQKNHDKVRQRRNCLANGKNSKAQLKWTPILLGPRISQEALVPCMLETGSHVAQVALKFYVAKGDL